jgi:hypothetical protein
MPSLIRYLNTDLDLVSPAELGALVRALETGGVFALHADRRDDGLWHATFETERTYRDPEENIRAFLAVIEGLAPEVRAAWDGCGLREFNVGYDSGEEPWAFNQGLCARTLGRIAAAGAGLRVTIYPPEPVADEGLEGS